MQTAVGMPFGSADVRAIWAAYASHHRDRIRGGQMDFKRNITVAVPFNKVSCSATQLNLKISKVKSGTAHKN